MRPAHFIMTTEGQEPNPRVYVADLAAYVEGELHGVWVDATQDEDDVWRDVQAMLDQSPVPGAEETAIHDHEHFEGISINEHESLSNVVKIARAIKEHGGAFAAWYGYHGDLEVALESFEEAYIGVFESEDALGEHLVDELGIESELEKLTTTLLHSLASYVKFDTAAWLRDMDFEGSLYTTEREGQVFAFWVT